MVQGFFKKHSGSKWCVWSPYYIVNMFSVRTELIKKKLSPASYILCNNLIYMLNKLSSLKTKGSKVITFTEGHIDNITFSSRLLHCRLCLSLHQVPWLRADLPSRWHPSRHKPSARPSWPRSHPSRRTRWPSWMSSYRGPSSSVSARVERPTPSSPWRLLLRDKSSREQVSRLIVCNVFPDQQDCVRFYVQVISIKVSLKIK